MRRGVRLLPGLVALAGLAACARATESAVGVNSLIVAVGSGAVLAATVGVPDALRPGVGTHKLLLETGIVLLGVQLSLGRVVDAGPAVVALVACVVAAGVALTELVGRAVGVGGETRPLLAAGASVCGVSAVVAVGGSIGSDETDIGYVAATVLVFDALTLVLVPLVGPALGLSGRGLGVWTGLTVFSTGPAAAAGFAVSDTVGRWATVTKLVRNTAIGFLALAYATRYAARTSAARGLDPGRLWSHFPKFLVGFCLVVGVTATGAVSDSTRVVVEQAGDWLFTLAFVGLGTQLDPARLRRAGAVPLGVVAVHLLLVGALAFGLVTVLL